jgi:hypothetical protein
MRSRPVSAGGARIADSALSTGPVRTFRRAPVAPLSYDADDHLRAAYATLGTAVGTITLAVATYSLARKTRDLATSGKRTAIAAEKELEHAGRQTEAAEAALSSSVRPMVIDVPRFTMRTMPAEDRPGETEEVDASPTFASIGESRTGSLLVPVRNVGAGVALGLAAAATFAQSAVGNPVARGMAPSVLAAGELGAIRFADTPGPASVAAGGRRSWSSCIPTTISWLRLPIPM